MFLKKDAGGINGCWSAWEIPEKSTKIPATTWASGGRPEIGERQHAPIQKLKFRALTNIFTISGEKVLVMKPVTYMNLSGEAVRRRRIFTRFRLTMCW